MRNPVAATIITVLPATSHGLDSIAGSLPTLFRQPRRAEELRSCERSENGGTTEAVGATQRRSHAFQITCAPSEQQAEEGITEIVTGVGEQCKRVGDDSENDLRGDVNEIQRRADRERGAEILRGVAVTVMILLVRHNAYCSNKMMIKPSAQKTPPTTTCS